MVTPASRAAREYYVLKLKHYVLELQKCLPHSQVRQGMNNRSFVKLAEYNVHLLIHKQHILQVDEPHRCNYWTLLPGPTLKQDINSL